MAKERCAFCGALNPANAQWCGQCLRQFPPEDISVYDPPAEADASEVVGTQSEAAAGSDQERAPAAAVESFAGGRAKAARSEGSGAFTVTEAGITWKCDRCETTNPLEAQVCSVCGTTFAEVVRPKESRPERDPNMVALISLFLPGAGHMYLHLWPQGIARAIVSLWVVSVVVVSLMAGGAKNAATVPATFGLVATALWVLGAHDAYREARGESNQVILKGRVFLYLVLGLLMLLFFLLVSAGLSARG